MSHHRNLLAWLLRPGVHLMRRLRLRHKLALTALLVSVPVLVPLADTVQDHLAARERWGAMHAASGWMAGMLELRLALAERQIDGADGAARQRLDAATQALDKGLADAPKLVAERWARLRSALPGPAGCEAGAVPCQAAIDHWQDLRDVVVEHGDLLADSGRRIDNLAHAIGRSLPSVIQRTAGLLGERQPGPGREYGRAQLWSITVTTGRLTQDMSLLARELETMQRDGLPPTAAWPEVRASIERLLAFHRTMGDPHEAVPIDEAQRLRLAQTSLQALTLLDRELEHSLAGQLAQRHDEINQRLISHAALAGVVLALLGYFTTCFHYSHAGALDRLLRGVRAMADGDLSQELRVLGRDELAEVGTEVDAMARSLSSTVSGVRSSAVRIGQAGEAVAGDGLALAQRTELQSAAAREAVATAQALRQSAEEAGRTADGAQARAQAVSEQARQGGQAMATAIEALAALEASIHRVAEINGTIDDIAYQTNLLALNAAVEAAKAGESGKGFSVVAGEVRQLAHRCAESASEIRALIDRTTDQVLQSAEAARGVSADLDGLAAGVDAVAERAAQLQQATAGFDQGLQGLVESMHGLQALAQDNASAAGRAGASARSLADEAARLHTSVAGVTLRYATADEAQALVTQALACIAESGWERAIARFNDPNDVFLDRDMYVFALDREGRYLVHGARPALVGTFLRDAPGFSGTMADVVIDKGSAAADAGGGWIEYTGVEWDGLTTFQKTAFVVPVDDSVFLGCGVAVNGDPRQAAARTAPADRAAGGLAAGSKPLQVTETQDEEEAALA